MKVFIYFIFHKEALAWNGSFVSLMLPDEKKRHVIKTADNSLLTRLLPKVLIIFSLPLQTGILSSSICYAAQPTPLMFFHTFFFSPQLHIFHQRRCQFLNSQKKKVASEAFMVNNYGWPKSGSCLSSSARGFRPVYLKWLPFCTWTKLATC